MCSGSLGITSEFLWVFLPTLISISFPPPSCEQMVGSVLWVCLSTPTGVRPGAGLVSPSPCKGNRREGCAAHVTGFAPPPSARVGLPVVRLRVGLTSGTGTAPVGPTAARSRHRVGGLSASDCTVLFYEESHPIHAGANFVKSQGPSAKRPLPLWPRRISEGHKRLKTCFFKNVCYYFSYQKSPSDN